MIRAVQITDAPTIQKLNADQLNYDYPLINTTQNLARLLSQPERHILLAATSANDQQVLGYVHAEVYLETYGPALFNILALAVSTTVQHRGVGCSLMTALAQQARLYHVAGIRLNSGIERQGAHQFYQQIGYTATKFQKRFFLDLESDQSPTE